VRREVPEDVPEVQIAAGESGEVHLPEALATAFGVSRSEARRALGQGGVRIGGEVAPGDRLDVPVAELDGSIIQLGKRRFALARVRSS
jgi:tyrosyl-tRNA synthetase